MRLDLPCSMSILVQLDGAIKAESCWREILNCNHAEFLSLIERGIFRNADQGYELSFVGIVVGRENIFFGAPKYWNPQDKRFLLIAKILRTYFSRSASRRAVDETVENLHFASEKPLREFDALHTLLEWYKNHGIYTHERISKGSVGDRDDWRRTLAAKTPMISGNGVLYAQTVSVRRTQIRNEISDLQVAILRNLLEKYEVPIPEELAQRFAELRPSFTSEINNSMAAPYFIRVIEDERRRTFRTDQLVLLDILSELLRISSGLSGNQAQQFFGTTAFYYVWEDACRLLFTSHDADSEGEELAQPLWHIRGDNGKAKKILSGGEQRPDVLTKLDGYRLILDAKYYFPFPHSKPGWGDIVKQLFYLESTPSDDGTKRINAFLLPDPRVVDFNYGGSVVVSRGPKALFSPIETWTINPDLVFQHYLRFTGRKCNDRVLQFIARRNNVLEDIIKTETSICT
ncbi:LlaJI family restriction endonuclease [Cupriavidus sp. WGlv3]|uniref:LlaJI family restriction endonuclease n=1 Tax=Cupriavidus sp. WGlv3 TaxID=2919924 RepID=UPI002091558D|nr:LlaJI family restriction endonuclease [Cupriavidus sp. WGlv3]MCO4862856.1 LlaJI family restriction endonuclease [Cupriavidus sp. WGlv3]